MRVLDKTTMCSCKKPDCYFCWLRNKVYTTTAEMPKREISSYEELLAILSEVSKASGVSVEQIVGNSRKEDFCMARQVFCYISRKMEKWTDKQIGLLIVRDRTTVIHSYNVIKNMLDTKEPKYTELGNRLGIKVANC